MTSRTRAKEVEAKRKRELREGSAGIRAAEAPKLFKFAAEEWMRAKKWKWKRTREVAENSLKHLLPMFGKRLLVDIEPHQISSYQEKRLADEVSGRTVNIEVGTLRGVLKRYGAWARLQPHVEVCAERDDAGRCLTDDEAARLLSECTKSRSRVLYPFVASAMETGARYGTIRNLQWKNIDFVSRCLTFGKDKTPAGAGRTIPLSQRAMEILTFWAEQFPDRRPEHYVLLHERYAPRRADDVFGNVVGNVYDSDPTRPTGAIKKAWEQARKRAGLDRLRVHDLRHTAVSRMIAAGVPLPIIGRIVGWKPTTLAKMAARYGHFTVDEMRFAVEAISSKREPDAEGSPQKSPQSGTTQTILVQ